MEIDTFPICSFWEPAQALAWDHTTQTLRKVIFVCIVRKKTFTCSLVSQTSDFPGVVELMIVSQGWGSNLLHHIPVLNTPPMLLFLSFIHSQPINCQEKQCLSSFPSWLHRQNLVWQVQIPSWFPHPARWCFFLPLLGGLGPSWRGRFTHWDLLLVGF